MIGRLIAGSALIGTTVVAQQSERTDGERPDGPRPGMMRHEGAEQQQGPRRPGQERGQRMGGPQNPMARHQMMQMMLLNPTFLKDAGATEQQIESVKTLVQETQMKEVDLRAATEKAELALQQLERASKTDEAALLKAVDALSLAKTEQLRQQVLSKVRIKNLLGEAVVKKLQERRPMFGGSGPEAGPSCRPLER